MEIVIDSGKSSLKVEVRKYRVEHRKVLDGYVANLLNIEFPKPCFRATCQAMPHLAPNHFKSKFKKTSDLR